MYYFVLEIFIIYEIFIILEKVVVVRNKLKNINYKINCIEQFT